MYLIPANISKKFEFFPGFGWKELFITVIPGLIGLGIALFLGLFWSSPIRFFLLVIFTGIGFIATRPIMGDGTSLLDIVIYMKSFSKKQKLYLYERGKF